MQPPSPVSQARPVNGMATAALVCGILSIALLPPACIAAIICGHIARARVRKDPALPGNDQAFIGLALGYLTLIMAGLILLIVIFSPPAKRFSL